MTDYSFNTGGGLAQLQQIVGDEPFVDSLIGQRLGDYRVESLLAAGGMGRVYRGDRVDGSFDRPVAIKVLPSGLGREYARRFELERRILASLTHPNIAQLYDAGVSDAGSLYLVMELINGQPIDHFTAGLDTRARTRLMLTLADALAFAHAKLVIHRDLKPSNVLVTADGDLKLLDFGIAKILETPDELTVAARPMTPRYASPEQLLNEPVSVASDIYQLGLVFLSLFQQSPEATDEPHSAATSRALQKRSLTVETRLAERLPAELAAIINKCLRAEPGERYASSVEFAADLRNYLNGFPVAARNPGRLQRSYKFFRRHWLASAAVSLLLG